MPLDDKAGAKAGRPLRPGPNPLYALPLPRRAAVRSIGLSHFHLPDRKFLRRYGGRGEDDVGYDDLGRRTSLVRGNGARTDYSYDAASRLSQLVQDPPGTSHDHVLGFAHNPASQIVANSRSNDLYSWTGQGSGTTNSTANGLNQLASIGSVTPTYDAKGNMTSDGTRTYGYTAENLLTQVNGGAAMAHDPLRRLYYTSQPISFAYDGSEMIAELSYGSGHPIARRYVHGPGTDEPLVWYEGSGTSDRRYVHADERGSIVAVSDSNGNVIGVNKYDEYGKPAPSNIGRFQYTGQSWLPEVGVSGGFCLRGCGVRLSR